MKLMPVQLRLDADRLERERGWFGRIPRWVVEAVQEDLNEASAEIDWLRSRLFAMRKIVEEDRR